MAAEPTEQADCQHSRNPRTAVICLGMVGFSFLALVMFGFTLSAQPYLQKMQTESFVWAFANMVFAVTVFTPTNIMLLAVFSAYFGMEWNKDPPLTYSLQWKQAMSIGVAATMATLFVASYLDFKRVFEGDAEMYARIAFATMILAYRYGYNPSQIVSWMSKQEAQPQMQVTTQTQVQTKTTAREVADT